MDTLTQTNSARCVQITMRLRDKTNLMVWIAKLHTGLTLGVGCIGADGILFCEATMHFTLTCPCFGAFQNILMRGCCVQLSIVIKRCLRIQFQTWVCPTYDGLNHKTRFTSMKMYVTRRRRSLPKCDTGRALVMLFISSDGIVRNIIVFHLAICINAMCMYRLGAVITRVFGYYIYQHLQYSRIFLDSYYEHFVVKYYCELRYSKPVS